MKVKELMSKDPTCATPDMTLGKVAKMMADANVGAIPIIENKDSQKVVGVVTDRDITTRAVALEKNPLMMKAMDIMSTNIITVGPDDDVEEVARLMEKNKIRRVPVVDDKGKVCGMVAQADIALKTSNETTANVVESISKPGRSSKK